MGVDKRAQGAYINSTTDQLSGVIGVYEHLGEGPIRTREGKSERILYRGGALSMVWN